MQSLNTKRINKEEGLYALFLSGVKKRKIPIVYTISPQTVLP